MARRLEVQIIGDSRSFERALGRASGASGRFGRIARRALFGAGVAVATGLGFAVKSAIEFESSFAGVRKTVDATEPQFERLAQGIRKMAMEIPTSANELNKIAESAGQLGIKREAILGFTRVVADLGETTNLVGEEAASSLARIANVMSTSQKDFDRLGSTIVALGNAGASTEAEIVAMSLRIAGAGKQAGLTEADVLGFANALSSVGIEAQAGGTAISKVMIEIAKEVAQGGDRLQDFAKVAGLSVDEFSQAFEKDAAGAIITFIEGLGKMSKEGKDVFTVLDDLGLGEIRVRDALLRASAAGDLFRDSLKTGSQAWKENTALTEEAAKRYETTAAQLQILRNNLVDIAISVGDVLVPVLRDAAERLTGFIQNIRDADGMRAKVSVVFAGIKGAVKGLVDELRKTLLGSTTRTALKLDSGKIIEWKTSRQVGLVASIENGLRGVDWTGIGQRVGEGISRSIRVTGDFIEQILTSANAFIDSNIDQFADLGAKMILAIVAKLADPAFWVRNWKLVVGVAIAVFPVGRLASLGGKAAAAMLKPLAKLLPAGFRTIGFRATQAILGVLGRLPGGVQRVILAAVNAAIGILGRLVSYLRGAFASTLGRIPFWLKAAFRLTVFLTFVNGIREGLVKVQQATLATVAFLQRQWDRVPGPIRTVIGVLREVYGWLRTLTSTPWTIILKIPTPSRPSLPGILDRITPGQHGIRNFGGGLALVGEAGPEIVALPRGSNVFTNSQSRAMAPRGGGSPDGRVEVIVVGGDRQAIAWFQQMMGGYARQNGGLNPA